MTIEPISILGALGGATIALSLVPQVYKTFTSKSARDISYAYQAVYIVGCTLVNVYAITEGLWPVYVPCLFEETLIVSLTLMKILYDRRDDKEKEVEECRRCSSRRLTADDGAMARKGSAKLTERTDDVTTTTTERLQMAA